jgi:hypothetical protein
LITGASAGIGEAFANRLERSYPRRVAVVVADLSVGSRHLPEWLVRAIGRRTAGRYRKS